MTITHDMNDIEKDIIEVLTKHNSEDYNIRKAVEELNELSTILMQKLNKPTEIKNVDITDELGDVEIRVKILKRMFGKDIVNKRISYKLEKYAEYLNNKTYVNI